MSLFDAPKNERARLLQLAARMREAITRSPATMSATAKRSVTELMDADTTWALSLLLAAWHLRSDPEVATLVAPYGLSGLYGQFDGVQLLPEFARKVADAKNPIDLAGAGGYFATVVEHLGPSVLRVALMTDAFQRARASLLRAFPEREAQDVQVQKPAEEPAAPAAMPRDKRFRTAGFRSRYPVPSAAPSPSTQTPPRGALVASSGATPLPEIEAPAPAESYAAALEWLGDVGYTPEEIDAITKRRVRFA